MITDQLNRILKIDINRILILTLFNHRLARYNIFIVFSKL